MAPTHTVYGSASPECPRIAFIVAPPRSGTTILEEILGAHPEVGHFYEPYYIWYYHAKNLANDCIAIEDIGPTEADWIRRQFKTFSRAARKGIIIEKSPEHSLNLPVVRYVFPQAKIIHIIRDGRDVTLSTKKEWQKRRGTVDKRRVGDLVKTAMSMLQRQPFWRFRLLALWYEAKSRMLLSPTQLFNIDQYFNKAKWKGYGGWGLRFDGWEEVIRSKSPICFMAHQWLRAVEQIQEDLSRVPEGEKLEIRYERLVSNDYKEVLAQCLNFLELPVTDEFWAAIPEIKIGNTRKWPDELAVQEIKEVGPILSDKLIELGYEATDQWYAV